jgi:hypothetical protein
VDCFGSGIIRVLSTHSRERMPLLSVIFFVMGPGVSNVLEIGTIPVRLNKPVVGFRPISECCQDGELWSLKFLFPLPLLHN